MDQNDIDELVNQLDRVTKELDQAQRDITREIVRKMESIQGMIENLPEAQASPREIILEKGFARIILRENGRTVFDGLF